MNDRILRIILRSNCPYFSSFSTGIQNLSKTPLFRTCSLETRGQQKRIVAIDRNFIVIVTPVRNGNNGRSWCRWNFRKTKIAWANFIVAPRRAVFRHFQTLIIRISFHHGGTAVPVSAGHRCFNKARRSNTVEYIWSPFLRNLSFAWNASRLSSNKGSPVRRNRSIHTGAQILVALFKTGHMLVPRSSPFLELSAPFERARHEQCGRVRVQ